MFNQKDEVLDILPEVSTRVSWTRQHGFLFNRRRGRRFETGIDSPRAADQSLVRLCVVEACPWLIHNAISELKDHF